MDKSLIKLRKKHLKKGHTDSINIDKLTSEKHHASNAKLIYTVNIMKCKECELTYLDAGLEYRR